MKAESRIDSGKEKLSKFSRYWKRQRDWKSFLVGANDVANEMIKLIPSPKLGGGENNICRPKTFNNRREIHSSSFATQMYDISHDKHSYGSNAFKTNVNTKDS